MKTYRSRSEAETQALGARLGARLRGGEVVLLCGDLGVGKTQFAKGVGKGLEVRGEVVSPTFTFVVQYEGRLPLAHYDLYRLRSQRELDEIGFLEQDDPSVVTLVEWGDRACVSERAIQVHVALESGSLRRIEIDGVDLEP